MFTNGRLPHQKTRSVERAEGHGAAVGEGRVVEEILLAAVEISAGLASAAAAGRSRPPAHLAAFRKAS